MWNAAALLLVMSLKAHNLVGFSDHRNREVCLDHLQLRRLYQQETCLTHLLRRQAEVSSGRRQPAISHSSSNNHKVEDYLVLRLLKVVDSLAHLPIPRVSSSNSQVEVCSVDNRSNSRVEAYSVDNRSSSKGPACLDLPTRSNLCRS